MYPLFGVIAAYVGGVFSCFRAGGAVAASYSLKAGGWGCGYFNRCCVLLWECAVGKEGDGLFGWCRDMLVVGSG